MVKQTRAEMRCAYDTKLCQLLDEFSQILIVAADNVGSNQLQNIRHGLRGDSVVLMGKNTMMKRSIRMHSDKTGNNAFLNLIPLLQVLNIPTKINEGTVEIITPVELIKKGDKVGSSKAALLAKLGIRPFSYSLIVQSVYDNGSVFSPEVLDLTDGDLMEKFAAGDSMVTSLSLQSHTQLWPLPHTCSSMPTRMFLHLPLLPTIPSLKLTKSRSTSRIQAVASTPLAAAAGGAAAPAAAKEEEKKEEPAEESVMTWVSACLTKLAFES